MSWRRRRAGSQSGECLSYTGEDAPLRPSPRCLGLNCGGTRADASTAALAFSMRCTLMIHLFVNISPIMQLLKWLQALQQYGTIENAIENASR